MRAGCFHQIQTNVRAVASFLLVEVWLRVEKNKTRVQPFKVTDVTNYIKILYHCLHTITTQHY